MSFAPVRKKKKTRPCERCDAPVEIDKTQCPSCYHNNVARTYNPGDDGTVLLSDASITPAERIATGDWDACWGYHIVDGKQIYGIVTCSVTLLGGAPGAGKSTLALALADRIAEKSKRPVLYISGEEDDGQIRSRALRMKVKNQNLIRLVPIGRAQNMNAILEYYEPAAIIVDSIPTVTPDMAEAVEFASTIKEWSSKLKAPAILIDHVTKEEEFAGLQALQHVVDTTLLFTVYEDEVRELRTVKNRNGPSGIRVFFDMTEHGLELNIDDREENAEDSDEDET